MSVGKEGLRVEGKMTICVVGNLQPEVSAAVGRRRWESRMTTKIGMRGEERENLGIGKEEAHGRCSLGCDRGGMIWRFGGDEQGKMKSHEAG